MNWAVVTIFLVSFSMGALAFKLLEASGKALLFNGFEQAKRGKGHRFVPMIALISLLTVGSLTAASVKTGWVIALVILLAGILGKSTDHNRRKIRSGVICRELPLLLDFLVLQVESGHSIQQSFKLASALFPENSPLNSGLLKFEEKIRLGTSVQTALNEMADFLGTTGAATALLTISQAIKHGTPLGEVLKNQSNRMREQLVLEGEKFANTVSIKLLIPLLFFIFPASFLVIFSPVIVSLTRVFP
jgi:tight adherence protein C